MSKSLNSIVTSSIDEAISIVDTATSVINLKSKYRTSHNMAAIATICKHLSILIYFKNMIDNTNSIESSTFIDQIEISIQTIKNALIDLATHCLK